MTDRSADYVIVGAGSAGCVLAARPTEDPAVQLAACITSLPTSVEPVKESFRTVG
jgi:hypothetical protein